MRWRTPGGGYRKGTFRLAEEARAFKTAIEHQLRTGTYVDLAGGRETFSDVARKWLASNPTKKATTYARDRTVIRVHLDPVIGAVRLVELAPFHCKAVVATMEAKIVRRGGRDKHLEPKTIQTNAGVLRAILTWAVDNDLIARSPYRGVRLPALKPSTKRIGDAADMLRLAEEVPVDYRVAILLGAMGLRLAEVTGLKVGAIDFLRKTVTVERTVNEVEGVFVVGDGKNRTSRRTFVLPSMVVEELAAHLARTGRSKPDDLVTQAPEGGPLRPNNFRRRVLNPALQRCDLEGLTFHRLRHSAGLIMREGGVPLEVIQVRFGHSSIRTTADEYPSLPVPVDRAVAAELDHLFRDAEVRGRGMSGVAGAPSCAPLVPRLDSERPS